MHCGLQSNQASDPEAFEQANDSVEPEQQVLIASPCWGVAKGDSTLLQIRPSNVCLNLEDLKCFEAVEHQFHPYGISFRNAIALQPSNPAYPPRTGTTVLMAAPKNGWLEVTFPKPVRLFCCYITSSQRTVLSAYDHQDNLLISQSLTNPNLADSDSPIPPNTQMRVEQPNISRITLNAFDGQLTVADLSYSF